MIPGKDHNEQEELLHRYFREELTAAQKEQVDKWKLESDENARQFEEARIFALDLKGLAYYKQVASVESSWEVFRKEHRVVSITKGKSLFVRYAASIVVVVSAVLGIYYLSSQGSDETYVAALKHVQEVSLIDGSLVTLNRNASLTYESDLGSDERRVALEGEGYFDIAKDEGRSFVVEVGEVEVRVLGTEFFINTPSEQQVEVKVTEGEVLISYRGSHELARENDVYVIDLVEGSITEHNSIDENGLSSFWRTRKLVFNATPLDEVVRVVNKAYGAQLIFEGSDQGCELSVVFDNEELENVIEIISNTLDVEVDQRQGSYFLKSNGCQ